MVIDELRQAIQSMMYDGLRSGVAAGEFNCPDVGMTTNAIMGMSIDVARWYNNDASAEPERIADHHAQMALRMADARRD